MLIPNGAFGEPKALPGPPCRHFDLDAEARLLKVIDDRPKMLSGGHLVAGLDVAEPNADGEACQERDQEAVDGLDATMETVVGRNGRTASRRRCQLLSAIIGCSRYRKSDGSYSWSASWITITSPVGNTHTAADRRTLAAVGFMVQTRSLRDHRETLRSLRSVPSSLPSSTRMICIGIPVFLQADG